jgi:hypothetical protein
VVRVRGVRSFSLTRLSSFSCRKKKEKEIQAARKTCVIMTSSDRNIKNAEKRKRAREREKPMAEEGITTTGDAPVEIVETSPAPAPSAAATVDDEAERVARKLKMYGHGTMESQDVMTTGQKISAGWGSMMAMRRELGGWLALFRVLSRTRTLSKQHEAQHLRTLREFGVATDAHARTLLAAPSMFCAIVEEVGSEDRACEVMKRVIEAAPMEAAGFSKTELRDLMPPGWTPEFAMRVYARAIHSVNAADTRCGVRASVDIEDTPTSMGFDVVRCAYAEAFRLVGHPRGTAFVCHGDDVLVGPSVEAVGLTFVRTGAIGYGNDRCDFRFVLTSSLPPKPTTSSAAAATADTAPAAEAATATTTH